MLCTGLDFVTEWKEWKLVVVVIIKVNSPYNRTRRPGSGVEV